MTDARRPLKSRATGWALHFSKLLTRSGVSANAISVMSVLFSAGAALLFYFLINNDLSSWFYLGAAAMIQLRLICNLMDGMVAIEGGKKSVLGDLYNEVPDRFADLLIIVGFGFGIQEGLGVHLGWLAASLAIMTAYTRLQGAALTKIHEFCGSMAKPQRMAFITGACILLIFIPPTAAPTVIFWVLVTMIVGEIITVWRRLSNIATTLKNAQE